MTSFGKTEGVRVNHGGFHEEEGQQGQEVLTGRGDVVHAASPLPSLDIVSVRLWLGLRKRGLV